MAAAGLGSRYDIIINTNEGPNRNQLIQGTSGRTSALSIKILSQCPVRIDSAGLLATQVNFKQVVNSSREINSPLCLVAAASERVGPWSPRVEVPRFPLVNVDCQRRLC